MCLFAEVALALSVGNENATGSGSTAKGVQQRRSQQGGRGRDIADMRPAIGAATVCRRRQQAHTHIQAKKNSILRPKAAEKGFTFFVTDFSTY